MRGGAGYLQTNLTDSFWGFSYVERAYIDITPIQKNEFSTISRTDFLLTAVLSNENLEGEGVNFPSDVLG